MLIRGALQERYDEIVNGLTPFLRSCGYNAKKDVIFLPMSGLLGHNIKDRLADNVAPWCVAFDIVHRSAAIALLALTTPPHLVTTQGS